MTHGLPETSTWVPERLQPGLTPCSCMICPDCGAMVYQGDKYYYCLDCLKLVTPEIVPFQPPAENGAGLVLDFHDEKL